MLIDFSSIDSHDAYFWLASTVTPRPVAWVASRSAKGIANLAPFSFFQVVTASPPTLMISPLLHPNGSLKDTTRNIQETGEFVVNLVPFDLVHSMNESSFSYDPDVSEFDSCAVPFARSEKVNVPRVSGVPVSFECRLASFMPYPEHSPSCHIILGEVLVAHVDESILTEQRRVDPSRLDLVSRMGASWYGRTRSESNFTLERPAGWDRTEKKA